MYNNSSKKVNILVVDDEPLVRRSLSEFLTLEGYTVSSASNGREALSTLKDYLADIVISDIKMPELDGIHLLGEIREKFPETSVIMITGYGTIRTGGLTNSSGKNIGVGSGNLDVIGPVVNDGVFGVEGGRVATFYGDVSGAGSFPGPGSYVFLSNVNPGHSPGIMDFGGNVRFTGTAQLCMELADNDNSDPFDPHYDRVNVAGDVALGGKLQLTWVPVPGDCNSTFGGVYNLVVYKGRRTGEFGEIVTALGAYLDGEVRYDVELGDGWKAVQITLHDLLDGDADLNGMVGYGDLLALFGGSHKGWSSGDFNFDGAVSAPDYILLKTNFGRSVPIPDSVSIPGSVPEPATLSLLVLGSLALLRRRGRK